MARPQCLRDEQRTVSGRFTGQGRRLCTTRSHRPSPWSTPTLWLAPDHSPLGALKACCSHQPRHRLLPGPPGTSSRQQPRAASFINHPDPKHVQPSHSAICCRMQSLFNLALRPLWPQRSGCNQVPVLRLKRRRATDRLHKLGGNPASPGSQRDSARMRDGTLPRSGLRAGRGHAQRHRKG